MPGVSIVIPAYNSMQHLSATLDSVFKQTYRDFELIVIDDGSVDHTEKYVLSLRDPRLRLISQTNQGASAARNNGIIHARGEYIAFLDDDDLWHPTKLEKQLRILEESPEVGLVYTWAEFIDEQGQSTGKIFRDHVEGDVWQELTAYNLVVCGSVPLVRKSCFETCGMFDLDLGSFIEDWDMWLRIANKYSFGVVREVLVYYRQRSTSSSKNWQKMSKGYALTIEKAFASVTPDLLYLKDRSYGFANLCLAWKPLQSKDKDYKKALYFSRQAIKCYPKLRFTKEYIRLRCAIAMMRILKPTAYSKIKYLFYLLRRLKSQ